MSKCQTFSVIFSLSPHCSGTIYGFNVTANKSVQQMAAKNGITLRLHRVIYKLIDQLKDDLSSKLPPTSEENIIGKCNFNILLILNSIKGWFFSFTSHASLTTRPRCNIYRLSCTDFDLQIETNIAQCVKWSWELTSQFCGWRFHEGLQTSHWLKLKLVRSKWKNEVGDLSCPWTLCFLPHTSGEASVLAMFDVTVGKKRIPVAGCRVQKGQLDKKMKFRLIRGRNILWEGKPMPVSGVKYMLL